jgi:hypothetical protein
MSKIPASKAQELIMDTFRSFSLVLVYNRRNIQYLCPLLHQGSFDLERILSDPELPNQLFDGLDAESYNYFLELCYELADLYNLATRDSLKGKRVAEEKHIAQSFQALPAHAALTDRDPGTREWTHESNYIAWINQYYNLSHTNRALRAEIDVIRARGGRVLSRQDRAEISRIEGKIQGNELIIADAIHRINTSFYRSRYGIHFITIENDLLQSGSINASTPRGRITEDRQYHIQQFDNALVRTLTTARDSFSDASFFFLAVGQPKAAVLASGISLAAAALLVFRLLLRGETQAAITEGAFIVFGVGLTRVGTVGVNRMLGISTNTRTIHYQINGNSWATIQNQIRRDFGKMSGYALSHLLKLGLEAFNEGEKE